MELNVKNRTIFKGDNLNILRGVNSESVDLIYLDPPFNSNRTYSAPIGSEAAGASFKDAWTLDDIDEAWHGEIADRDSGLYRVIDSAELSHGKGMKSYLIFMAVRLLEMKRILKSAGSIYLHCDPTASHYLKLVMDAVFGKENFRNEIVWHYYNVASVTRKYFGHKHDIILWYSLSSSSIFHWDDMREDYSPNSNWIKSSESYEDNRYKPDKRGKLMHDVWRLPTINNMAKERTGYPTQKPLVLLERIIKASSNAGDVVLDPFCGCATTCVAAEALQREWIGIDLSLSTVKLVNQRLRDTHGLFGAGIHRTDIPRRTDLGELPNYSTHKHTLYGKQEGLCNGCMIQFPFRNMTIDHIVPRVKGGQDDYGNLQLLCNACNSVKGKREQAYLIARLKEQRII